MKVRKFISVCIASILLINSLPVGASLATGQILELSVAFRPPVLNGLKIFPKEPLRFDFILDKGDVISTDDQIKKDSMRLIKYFLASLTIPEQDLWVNLSPYEKDRIISESFGKTEMGQDLLAQDFILKQITTSFLSPDDKTGKKFWQKVYMLAQEKYGTTDIPVNVFNKVWIVPETADVYENKNTMSVYITDARLKVMIKKDYLATQMSVTNENQSNTKVVYNNLTENYSEVIADNVLREIMIPALNQEVNEGKDFVLLRQVYRSLILAAWYKKNIQRSLLNKVYVDRNKIAGVNTKDLGAVKRIWSKYEEAFTRNYFSIIKEETGFDSDKVIPRQYTIGGVGLGLSPYLRSFSGDEDKARIIPTGQEIGLTVNVVAAVDNSQNVFDPKDMKYLETLSISSEEAVQFLALGSLISGSAGVVFGLSPTSDKETDQSKYLSTLFTRIIKERESAGKRTINIVQIGIGSSAIETKDIVNEIRKAFKINNIDSKMQKEWQINFIAIDRREDWLKGASNFLENVRRKGLVNTDIWYKGFKVDFSNEQEMADIAKTMRTFDQEWTADFLFFRNTNYANKSAEVLTDLISEPSNSMRFELSATKTLSIYISLRNIFKYFLGPQSLFITEPAFENAKKVLQIPGTTILSEVAISDSDKLLPDLNNVKDMGTGIYRINNIEMFEDGGIEGFLRFNMQPLDSSEKKMDEINASPLQDEMQNHADTGGIDLNLEKFASENVSTVGDIKFDIDPVMFEQLDRASGLSPLILNFFPHADVKLFLGLK